MRIECAQGPTRSACVSLRPARNVLEPIAKGWARRLAAGDAQDLSSGPSTARGHIAAAMNFEILTAAPDVRTADVWRDFLTRADFACHYVTPEFFREPQFKSRGPFAILISEGGRIMAVASGILDGRTVQCGLQSRPQLSIDPTADRTMVARTLAEAFEQTHGRARCVTVVAWSPLPELTQADYRERVYDGEAGIVLLDLRRGPDALFREFSESRRTNIRKAMRRGMQVVEASTEEDIAAYFPIYCEWSRSKGHVPVPYPQFRETLEVRSNRRLFLARHEDATIAGVVVRFSPGGLVEFAANASSKADQSLRPNDLLHWKIIEWASAQGFTTYSLGGAHLFLRRFGGTVVSTYEYRLDRTLGKRLELRDRLLDAARSSWKRLPEPLRRRIRNIDAGAASRQD
jgi:hypothetical protein